MSPLYEYRCAEGHTREELRSADERDAPAYCPRCMEKMERLPPMPHVPVDGIYSYAPNIGTAAEHERKNEVIRARQEGREGPPKVWNDDG